MFKLIELKNRYNNNPLPKVELVDLKNENRSGNLSFFSSKLVSYIDEEIKNKRQVILFLNRRGYSSYVTCRDCGFVLKCRECGITVPYHKEKGVCECHYCGRKISYPKVCPVCGSKHIGGIGIGTEQIEETAKALFKDAKVERLDFDSIKKKGELESILDRFSKNETNILIGTQLVAKGFDFSNVGLVGVISADVCLNIPDYRSNERTFQLLTQAAGRSGRGDTQGKVVIQSYYPDNRVLLNSSNHDYENFYKDEIELRKLTSYPPFSDLYQILIMDADENKAYDYSKKCADYLRTKLKDVSVLGPSTPLILKESGLYRYQVIIKADSNYRDEITEILRFFKENHQKKVKVVSIDINPYSLS